MYHQIKKDNIYLRKALYETYERRCVYCGDPLSPKQMQIDHILAVNSMKSENPEFKEYISELKENGFKIEQPDYIENYVLCCENCNLRKSNRNFYVSNLRFYHDMATKRTPRILELMRKYEEGGNVEDFQPVLDDPLKYLDLELKEYIIQKFEDYKIRNISVRTPQLMLILLTYSTKNIINILNGYKMNDGGKYGEFLVAFFQEIDKEYETKGQIYREEDWTAFLRVLENAKEVLHNEKYEDYITANILCYSILTYRDGATVSMMRAQMGIDRFEQMKQFILDNRIPSFSIYME